MRNVFFMECTAMTTKINGSKIVIFNIVVIFGIDRLIQEDNPAGTFFQSAILPINTIPFAYFAAAGIVT